MKEPLDLHELEEALTGLQVDLSGRSLEDLMLDVGGIVQSKWRDNILSEGLVDTGAYLESIRVQTVRDDAEFVQVEIGSDVRNDRGVPYPAVLEFGDSELVATPVGTRAFDESKRKVVKEVADRIERKVVSRSAKR